MPDSSGGIPIPVEELSAPARRALAGAGYVTLEQLAGGDETTIEELHGVGPTTLETLRAALDAQGLSFEGGE